MGEHTTPAINETAEDGQAIVATFEEACENSKTPGVGHGHARFSIVELGVSAASDRVKPTLLRRPIRKTVHWRLIGRRGWSINGALASADLYEAVLPLPDDVVEALAIIENPATTLVLSPNVQVSIDGRTLLHYLNG